LEKEKDKAKLTTYGGIIGQKRTSNFIYICP